MSGEELLLRAAGGLAAAAAPADPLWLRIGGGRVLEVGFGRAPRGSLDLGNVLLAPAFLDLQVNGHGDVDFASATPEALTAELEALAASGLAGCLLTLVSAPRDAYAARLDRVAAARRAPLRPGRARAEILGVHLEGPFLGGAPGAHPPAVLGPVDLDWLRDLLDAYPDLIRVVTLAPEADPGLAATRFLADRGVVVALGHSTATHDEALAAAAAGARVVTHLFNGMGPMHHRAPGLAGAALSDARLSPTIIADGVHVHPAMVVVAARAAAGAALVTDSVAAASGSVAGLDIVEEGGAARLSDGTLAGSTITMADAVRNTVRWGLTPARAVTMAATRPAELLGLADRGRLIAGARADVVALDPRTGELRGAWIGGVPAAHPGDGAGRG